MNKTSLLSRRSFSSLTLFTGLATGLPISIQADTKNRFILPDLPFPEDALDPVISAKTLSFHYGKHHRGYVNTLNKLTAGTPDATRSLEEIILSTRNQPEKAALFNNAAQVWNHTFFWHSLTSATTSGSPSPALAKAIQADFGSLQACKTAMLDAAVKQFGSGWVWLVFHNGHLSVQKTSNAETPAGVAGVTPLFTLDVWEHAYYLDWQNRRADYAKAVLDKLIHWKFVSDQFALASR